MLKTGNLRKTSILICFFIMFETFYAQEVLKEDINSFKTDEKDEEKKRKRHSRVVWTYIML